MKTFKLFLMPGAVVLLGTVSCMESVTIGKSSIETAELLVDTTEFVLTSAPQTLTVPGTTPNDVEVNTSVSWLSATVENNTITLNVAENNTLEDRSGTVTLSYSGTDDVNLQVTQVVPVISVANSEVGVSYEAGTTYLSYSVANPVEGETLSATVTTGNSVVTSATVDSGNSQVALYASGNTSTTSTRSATVTLSYPYAKDVELSVVQGIYVYSGYTAFLGTWEVTDSDHTVYTNTVHTSSTATVTISQNVVNESYTISGWQFSGDYTDFTDLGYYTSCSMDFPAYYNPETEELEFHTYDFGDNSRYYNGEDVNGYIKLGGAPDSSGNSHGVAIMFSYDGLITSIALTDADTAVTSKISSFYMFPFSAMHYGFKITSDGYSGYLRIQPENATYFPLTFRRISSSTDATTSDKSSRKPVTETEEVKCFEVSL